MLKLRSLTKSFGTLRAVDEVSLEFKEGEFFSLLGPSGCGKSTLLRLLAGLESPDSGELFLDGKPLEKTRPEERPFNMVFQRYALFPHLSVFENVAFGLRVKHFPEAEIRTRVKEALEAVQMPELESRNVTTLSGGQQQRVALARAWVNRPRVLLLDEPLSALDLKLRSQMQVELRDLQRRLKITFIFVTHDQDEALSLSDRIAVMNQGKVQQVGTPREIYDHPANGFVANFIGTMNRLPGGVLIRPEKIKISTDLRSSGKLQGTVKQIVFKGPLTHYFVESRDGTEIRVIEPSLARSEKTVFHEGQRVSLCWSLEDERPE